MAERPDSLSGPRQERYLRGVEVIDHMTFTYTGEAQSVQWIRFGFKMHLPDHALPPGVNECQIQIQASMSGQFQFPEDTEILSSIYWVTCPHKFAKPVTVEIQHCANLEHLQYPSNLTFIVAKCTPKYLPYQFKILDGGVFSPNSRYGSIQLTHFSGLGIAFHSVMQWLGLSSYQPQLAPKNYCARLYYSSSGIHSWEVYFTIMWDLELYIAAIDAKYTEATARVGPDQVVMFEEEQISLDIPEEGVMLESGWTITPHTYSVITKQQVDRFFLPGCRVSSCQLHVKWTGQQEKAPELEHKVRLLGAKEPFNFILIRPPSLPASPLPLSLQEIERTPSKPHVSSGGETERTPNKPQLKDLMNALYHKVADKWKVIGLYLEIPKGKLAHIAEKCQDDPHSCFVEVLETWLERVHPPPTWTAIIEAVEFLGEEQLGNQLRVKYSEPVEFSLSSLKLSGDSPLTRKVVAERMEQRKPKHGLVESTFRLSGDSPLTGELGVERMKRKRLEHGPQFKHHILKGDICFLGDPWQEAATSAGKEISWGDIGIKINIPPGAIPEDKLITVSVQPCLSGPFELPEDYELASPVYAISPGLEFNKDVKLFMAHFADLQSEDYCKNMTFLTTPSPLPGDSSPYKLIVQENGVFQRGSSVGELSMRHFCKKAIGRKRKQDGKIQHGNAKHSKVILSREHEPKKDQQGGAEQSKVNGKPQNLYLVQLYQNTGDYPIDNIAAVTVSLHQPVYAMNFKKCLEEWYPSFHFVPSGKVVRFSSRGKASVKFPTDVQGWSIVSDIQPCEIHRMEVDLPILTPHLDYSTALTYPPKRLLTISPPPAEVGLPYSNDCPLLISGFSEKVQFTLKLRPRPYMLSMMEVQRQPPTLPELIRFKTRSGSINILEKIGTHYKQLGILLLEDTTGAITKAIIKHSHDATEISLQILEQWIQGKGKKPVEWSTFIEVLNDIGLCELANEIKHTLK